MTQTVFGYSAGAPHVTGIVAMFVVRAARSFALRRFVESLWFFRGDAWLHERERVLPSSQAQLLVNLSQDSLRAVERDGKLHQYRGAAVCGLSSESIIIDTAQQQWIVGAQFRLGGTQAFFAHAAHELADTHVQLCDLWGRAGAVVRERLLSVTGAGEVLTVLEQVLVEQLLDAERTLPRDVTYAVASLRGGQSVATVSRALNMDARRVRTRFADYVGLSPKRYARVVRLEGLLADVPEDKECSWAALAATHGYYDQAHLIREFRLLTGVTPGEYAPRSAFELRHVPIKS